MTDDQAVLAAHLASFAEVIGAAIASNPLPVFAFAGFIAGIYMACDLALNRKGWPAAGWAAFAAAAFAISAATA